MTLSARELPADENLRTIDAGRSFVEQAHIKPEAFWPFWGPCQVRLLIVADGSLDFSEGDFGLSTFVRSLLDMPGRYVRFRITLAHINNVSATQMLDSESRIVRRVTGFKFDVADHFKPDMFDEVMLFGILTSAFGRGNDASGQPYPTNRLGDAELRALTQFMNAGGGLFATGDHGALGRFLCHAVPRARNMRLWQSTAAQEALDEVSMTGERRNDTNRIGKSAGSQFDDQSDDTPQFVYPRIYQRTTGLFRHSFPHPLLCGPNGMIRVMPDHPHEGECVTPSNTGSSLNFGGALGAEYPDATDGGAKPVPEVISTSIVFSGMTAEGQFGSMKQPTQSQTFGGICAYDGHRAGVGRVVTDATWHHFVNVNLIGQLVPPLAASNAKSRNHPGGGGFLASAAGRAHLAQIRTYYRNIAVWMAPPPRIKCMNTRLVWDVLWSGRILEAVMSTVDLRVVDVQPHILLHIGKHARDVLGQYASQCQTTRLILDLVVQPALPRLVPDIDPWLPEPAQRRPPPDRVDWFDGTLLLDIGLGAALLGLREAFPQPDADTAAELDTDRVAGVMSDAGRVGIEQALASAVANANTVSRYFDVGRETGE